MQKQAPKQAPEQLFYLWQKTAATPKTTSTPTTEPTTVAPETAQTSTTVGPETTSPATTSPATTSPASIQPDRYTIMVNWCPKTKKDGSISRSAKNAGGDCFLLQLPDNKFVLLDSGLPGAVKNIYAALKNYPGSVVVGIILTHYDKDHWGGLEQILKDAQGLGEARDFLATIDWVVAPSHTFTDNVLSNDIPLSGHPYFKLLFTRSKFTSTAIMKYIYTQTKGFILIRKQHSSSINASGMDTSLRNQSSLITTYIGSVGGQNYHHCFTGDAWGHVAKQDYRWLPANHASQEELRKLLPGASVEVFFDKVLALLLKNAITGKSSVL